MSSPYNPIRAGSGAAAPTRLMNKQVNPYWGMLKKNQPQSAVYIHGQDLPPGLEGGFPTWLPIEFPALGAYETQDSQFPLPEDFTLLYLLRHTSQPADGFAIQLYDVIQGRWITAQLTEAGCVAGALGNVLCERVPHTFSGPDPQVLVRVVNQSANVADIMLALQGVVGGDQS